MSSPVSLKHMQSTCPIKQYKHTYKVNGTLDPCLLTNLLMEATLSIQLSFSEWTEWVLFWIEFSSCVCFSGRVTAEKTVRSKVLLVLKVTE